MGRYLARGAFAEAKILARRQPIAQLAADSTTPPAMRAKLRLVLEARRFAVDSLGLPAKESFTQYTKLEHDTLVLVLSGAYRDELRPVTWWFPVVGRVPYKGFFDFAEAQAGRGGAAGTRASTRTCGRRRRSARSGSSTTRCSPRRWEGLAGDREHRDSRADAQQVLREGRGGVQRELRELRRRARGGAVLRGAGRHRERAAHGGAVARRSPAGRCVGADVPRARFGLSRASGRLRARGEVCGARHGVRARA